MPESAESRAWRALEDASPAAAGPAAAPDGTAAQLGWRLPATWVLGGLASAAILAGIAIWLALTSGHGSIVVEGDGPGPERSGRPAAVADGSGPLGGSGAEVVVDVQGAVARPGVVRLSAGSRVADAIAAAGGYGPRVAADRVGQALNLAAELKDGDQVVVPSRDDPVAGGADGGSGGAGGGGGGGGGTAGGSGATGPIDLNRATASELDGLPGIGPVTAAKIIAARDEQPFTSVDELRSRKILGAATFDKVKDLVTVR
jgi:competence protein ComEA